MSSPTKSEPLKLNLAAVTETNEKNTAMTDSATTPLLATKPTGSAKMQSLLSQAKAGKAASGDTTSTAATTTAIDSSSATAATSAPTAPNDDAARLARLLLRPAAGATAEGAAEPGNDRLKSELVRKNWKTVLDVALKKAAMENEMSGAGVGGGGGLNRLNSAHPREIYATDKENWVFFSIILTIVVILSVLFCFVVYWFFPQFRAKSF
jgi:hypothetical protein